MDATDLVRIGEQLRGGGVLTGPQLAELAELDRDGFGASTLGIVWDELALGRARAHVVPTDVHLQPLGLVHGGVWCGVVESLASMGAAAQVAADGRFVVGVSNSTDFLRAHRHGRVDAVAEALHVGRTQQLWQVVLTRTEDGKTVARGQVRLQNVDAAPSGSV